VHDSVSIIIRSYNEEEHIGRLLEGIFEQSVKNSEVISVDSGSTDKTLEIANMFPVIVHEIKPGEFSLILLTELSRIIVMRLITGGIKNSVN
jgi:glycosyltransferase involved in cell wall biosynthesis